MLRDNNIRDSKNVKSTEAMYETIATDHKPSIKLDCNAKLTDNPAYRCHNEMDDDPADHTYF